MKNGGGVSSNLKINRESVSEMAIMKKQKMKAKIEMKKMAKEEKEAARMANKHQAWWHRGGRNAWQQRKAAKTNGGVDAWASLARSASGAK